MLPSSLKVKKNTSNYDLYDEYIYVKDKEKVNNYIKEFENKRKSQVSILKDLLEKEEVLKKLIAHL